MWAPDDIEIGANVYIGKDVHIECNSRIGDYCLIANRVSFIGRHDHQFSTIGVPVRFSQWVGSAKMANTSVRKETVNVEDDVWIGFGSIILSGVTIGRGAIVGAGSIVTKDIPPYQIFAGSPAKKIGVRFDQSQIKKHEDAISKGRFVNSERGYDHSTIEIFTEDS
jgi:acetyltransferase-like isoleucine patch superfamily enzyme